MQKKSYDNEKVITPKGVRGENDPVAFFDLTFLLAKRTLSVKYKQTVLGPLWLLLVPVLSSLVHAFVFGGIAGLSSGNAPYFLFYMVGNTAWLLFYYAFSSNAHVFVANRTLFKNVYFQRLAVPVSNLVCALFTFVVQFALTLVFLFAFSFFGVELYVEWRLLPVLVPLVVYIVAFAFALSLITSALTAKYRDLTSLEGLFLELYKYVTPVVYLGAELSSKVPFLSFLPVFDPLAPAIECFRYVLLGPTAGSFSALSFLVGGAEILFVLAVGLLLFRRAERNFVDTL